MFFTDEMFKHIAHHANLHIAQQNITKGSIATDKDQIEAYKIIIQAPYYRMYWENDTWYDQIFAIMSWDGFELMK